MAMKRQELLPWLRESQVYEAIVYTYRDGSKAIRYCYLGKKDREILKVGPTLHQFEKWLLPNFFEKGGTYNGGHYTTENFMCLLHIEELITSVQASHEKLINYSLENNISVDDIENPVDKYIDTVNLGSLYAVSREEVDG